MSSSLVSSVMRYVVFRSRDRREARAVASALERRDADRRRTACPDARDA